MDGNGGLAVFAGNTYSYDALQRLVEVDNSLGKYLFRYDPLGRRVQKILETPGGSVTATYSYHYDGSEVAVEYQPMGTWTYDLGLGIDQPVLRVNGTTKQWYYADAQGSISAVADNAGNILEQYEYNAQGQFQVANASGVVQNGIPSAELFQTFPRDVQSTTHMSACAALQNSSFKEKERRGV